MDDYKIRSGVTMPEPKRGPSETYPFDKLGAPAPVKDEKGKPVKDDSGNTVMELQSFPVQRTAKQMASTVYSAMRRYSKEKTDDKGEKVLDEKGKPVVIREREFKCFDVDPKTDPDGAMSRVWRTK